MTDIFVNNAVTCDLFDVMIYNILIVEKDIIIGKLAKRHDTFTFLGVADSRGEHTAHIVDVWTET